MQTETKRTIKPALRAGSVTIESCPTHEKAGGQNEWPYVDNKYSASGR